LIHASFGSSLTIPFHHVPRCWRHRDASTRTLRANGTTNTGCRCL
jgi:hypothetical protein